MTSTLDAVFFKSQHEFRNWLELNYRTSPEIIVGYYKVKTRKPTMSWSESVDQALCFGWIDGIRRSIDDESYCIRFTPRRKSSIWSAINIKKVEELTKKGLMTDAGLNAFKLRNNSKLVNDSYENRIFNLSDDLERKFRNNELAWTSFQNQSPSYKKMVISWVMSAKQDKTRENRLNKLIADSENNRKLNTLSV